MNVPVPVRLVCIAVTVWTTQGCSWEPLREPGGAATPEVVASDERAVVAKTAADTARQMLGVPYKWGGHTPAGFDCSGLVFYAYGRQGVQLPRTAARQMAATVPVTLAQSLPGDLIFFHSPSKGGHVGILIDRERFVHAPSQGKSVSVGTVTSPWYRDKLIRAGRVLRQP